MADEQQELRRVNWNEVVSFSHVFKSFRMAIHPSKILLALAAIVLIYACGHVLDWFWGLGNQRVATNEIYNHFSTPSGQFDQAMKAWKDGQLEAAADLFAKARDERHRLTTFGGTLSQAAPSLLPEFRKQLEKYNKEKEDKYQPRSRAEILKEAKEQKKSYGSLLGDASEEISDETAKVERLVEEAYTQTRKLIKENKDLKDEQRDELLEALSRHKGLARRELTERKVTLRREVLAIRGRGIFESLLVYEWRCLGNAISAVRHGNILGNLSDYRRRHSTARALPAALAVGAAQDIDVPGPAPADSRAGFLYWLLLGLHGVVWLITVHWVYAIVFLIICLAICALFGGAVHRIAAVQFARNEKISMGQALKFSAGKFLSFFTAPLIPLVMIFIFALCLFLGGLIGSIPYVGEIIMAVLFFLAILVGLAIAFMTVGLVGGGALMYPTIAVEGSDSFDAISRSFSYVFARPWRAILYGLVALVYGVITYLFVRLFVYVSLVAAHFFVKWGVFGQGAALGPNADKLDVIWTAPTFDSLFGPFRWEAMSGIQPAAAFIVGIWVFLAAGVTVAYLLTYFASSATVIYCLLRRRVDATDLDDVYIEEAEEEPLPGAEAGEEAEKPPEPSPPEEPAEQGGEQTKE